MKVLVTGAANGLGHALAKAHLARGDRVIGVDREAGPMQALAATHTERFVGFLCDLADRQAVRRLPDRLEGPFDRVILNAGISATGRFEEIDGEAYERVLEVNAATPILLSNALLDRMERGGRLVFVSSLSHVTGYPGAAVYAATKDAIAIYAKSVAKPLARRGIGVTTVFPGPIRTAHAERHAPPDARAEKRMDPDDLARRIVKAADRGEAVLYPGAGALGAYVAGGLAPNAMTRLMRRLIFERLDGTAT